MNPDRKDSSAPFWCTVLLGAALLYPASFGPWIYAASQFDLPTPVVAVAEFFFRPIEIGIERLPEGIAEAYVGYLYWWAALSGHRICC